mgnify:CR=1 FL=1
MEGRGAASRPDAAAEPLIVDRYPSDVVRRDPPPPRFYKTLAEAKSLALTLTMVQMAPRHESELSR